ncbi:5976_t:CDS:2, partial [Racocetra persica]
VAFIRYILTMENGTEYIRRVAFHEYPRWKTESEVAVMKYVRLNMNIPVPKIYYWNSSIYNPVGAEYILMERLPGRRLCKSLKKLTFSRIGSIFFDGKSNDQFKIGQVVEIDFFVNGRATLSMDRGPFNTTKEYVLAAIRNQILYCHTFKSQDQQNRLISMYETLCKLVPKYFPDDERNKFVLTHVWITDNPMANITKEESEENLMLQKVHECCTVTQNLSVNLIIWTKTK